MHVTVLSTGGTIASTGGEDGATPTKTGGDLLAALPDGALPDLSVAVEDVARVPSYELDGPTLEKVGDRVAALDADDGVEAVVVTHGTDTMAETAYYLDVARRPATPVFLTGAQRRPDEVSADGPANLLAAFRAASAFADRDAGGVFVAFDDEVHAARGVTKTHTSSLGAFASPETGPVASLDRTGVHVHRTPESGTDPLPAATLDARVPMVKSASGVDASLLDAAVDTGADGLVVEGTGLGNVTGPLGDAIGRIAEDLPVVVASRCPAGRTAPVYGGPGGGETLRDHGVAFAGDLPAHTARIRLQLALAAHDDRASVLAAFDS